MVLRVVTSSLRIRRRPCPIYHRIMATRGIVSIDGFNSVYNNGLSTNVSNVLLQQGSFFNHVQVAPLYKIQLRTNRLGPSSFGTHKSTLFFLTISYKVQFSRVLFLTLSLLSRFSPTQIPNPFLLSSLLVSMPWWWLMVWN